MVSPLGGTEGGLLILITWQHTPRAYRAYRAYRAKKATPVTRAYRESREFKEYRGPSGDNTKYAFEAVAAPTTGTLTLKMATATCMGTLTNANVFTVALPTPVAGWVNESVLIFKIGATLPTITMPTPTAWRMATPTLTVNSSFTIVFEQVYIGGSYEKWLSYSKNV